jgi:hypothetical protein
MPKAPIQFSLQAVAEAASGVGGIAFSDEPEADANLCAVEKWAEEGARATDEISLGPDASDVAFAGGVGGHAAIGDEEAGNALQSEVVEEALHPEVGFAFWRDAQ